MLRLSVKLINLHFLLKTVATANESILYIRSDKFVLFCFCRKMFFSPSDGSQFCILNGYVLVTPAKRQWIEFMMCGADE